MGAVGGAFVALSGVVGFVLLPPYAAGVGAGLFGLLVPLTTVGAVLAPLRVVAAATLPAAATLACAPYVRRGRPATGWTDVGVAAGVVGVLVGCLLTRLVARADGDRGGAGASFPPADESSGSPGG